MLAAAALSLTVSIWRPAAAGCLCECASACAVVVSRPPSEVLQPVGPASIWAARAHRSRRSSPGSSSWLTLRCAKGPLRTAQTGGMCSTGCHSCCHYPVITRQGCLPAWVPGCQTLGQHRSQLLQSALSQCDSPRACCCCCCRVRVLQATFAAAHGVPRHPNKPGVTARRVVPILPDVEAWPNKYVVVQFPEGDPAHDSRTLAKVRGVFLCFWKKDILGRVCESCRRKTHAGSNPRYQCCSGVGGLRAARAGCTVSEASRTGPTRLPLLFPGCHRRLRLQTSAVSCCHTACSSPTRRRRQHRAAART